MRIQDKFLAASLMVIGLGLGTAAWAADPSVSVPSTPDTNGKVLIKGMNLPAYSSVTVRFNHDKMSPMYSIAQVASNGTFSVSFEPPIVGGYAVVVYDGGGRQIGQGNFGYFR